MISNKPLVSVLVPICNVEQYLDECLASLQQQTFKNFEVICINDGSTDNSSSIIQKYIDSDQRFKVIDKPNSGYGDSMNKGLEAAVGKYISILESDDFIDADMLEFMVGEAEKYNLDVMKTNFWLYWSNPIASTGFRENVYHEAISCPMVEAGVHRPIDFPEIFWSKPSIWSAIYLKEFLDKNNIRFLPTPGASFQDTSFTFKVFSLAKRVKYSMRPFLHYRQDNEKSSVNNPTKVFCVCDEHAEMKKFLDEGGLDNSRSLNIIRVKVKFYNYLWNLHRLSPELKDSFIQRFSKEMNEEIAAGFVDDSGNVVNGNIGLNSHEISEIYAIAQDPCYYLMPFICDGNRLHTIKLYYKNGGLSYVTRLLKEKLMRRG